MIRRSSILFIISIVGSFVSFSSVSSVSSNEQRVTLDEILTEVREVSEKNDISFSLEELAEIVRPFEGEVIEVWHAKKVYPIGDCPPNRLLEKNIGRSFFFIQELFPLWLEKRFLISDEHARAVKSHSQAKWKLMISRGVLAFAAAVLLESLRKKSWVRRKLYALWDKVSKKTTTLSSQANKKKYWLEKRDKKKGRE